MLWTFCNSGLLGTFVVNQLWLPAVHCHCTEAAWPSVHGVGHTPAEVGHNLVEAGHNPGAGHNLEGEHLQTLPLCNRQGQTCGSLKCAGIFRSKYGQSSSLGPS